MFEFEEENKPVEITEETIIESTEENKPVENIIPEISEKSKAIKDSLLRKNKEVDEVVKQVFNDEELLPKGKIFQEQIQAGKNFGETIEPNYGIPKVFQNGKHKKTCECKICVESRKSNLNTNEEKTQGETKPNTEFTTQNTTTENGTDKKTIDPNKPKPKIKHGQDILTMLWETTVLPIVSFFAKVSYKDLLFVPEETKILKAVQPDSEFLAYKNWFLYCVLLITLSIKKILILKNPFLKEHFDEINNEAKEKSNLK